jgi:NAD-dependent deacetylase
MKKKLVVLSGAGISAESGVKTFRDAGGLWEGHDIMEVASPGGWRKSKETVLKFYNARHAQMAEVEPNLAHKILGELEQYFDVTIITQNVDDLHERGGSTNVIHLHGELMKKRSSLDPELKYPWPLGEDINIGDKCEEGSQLRPDIVWFGESVPLMSEAIKVAKNADIFLVIGTSLNVYPAASLIDYIPGDTDAYIIDPNVPVYEYRVVYPIAKTATEGMKEFKETLLRDYL